MPTPHPQSTTSVRARRWARARVLLTAAVAEAARPVIGGQAVIEGVMMRSPQSFAVAVRRPDKSIVVREERWLSLSERFPVLKLPLLRGATMLVESMYNGLNALNFSALQAFPEEDAAPAPSVADDAPSAHADAGDEATRQGEGDDDADSPREKGGGAALWLTLAASMGFAVLLFKGVPHFTTALLGTWLGGDGPTALPVDAPLFHLVDGVIKLGIFVGYILLISRLDDVRRLFMYHGAEHMSVHSYEADLDLTVENTRPQSTAHPRCGTTLILLVISTSILVFVGVIPLLPQVSDQPLVQLLFTFAIKVPLMLPIAGLAYELQRLAAKRPDSALVQLFIAPGMWMQKLTTRKPTDGELEVALAALRKTTWRERLVRQDEAKHSLARGERAIEIFADFAEVTRKVA